MRAAAEDWEETEETARSCFRGRIPALTRMAVAAESWAQERTAPPPARMGPPVGLAEGAAQIRTDFRAPLQVPEARVMPPIPRARTAPSLPVAAADSAVVVVAASRWVAMAGSAAAEVDRNQLVAAVERAAEVEAAEYQVAAPEEA